MAEMPDLVVEGKICAHFHVLATTRKISCLIQLLSRRINLFVNILPERNHPFEVIKSFSQRQSSSFASEKLMPERNLFVTVCARLEIYLV